MGKCTGMYVREEDIFRAIYHQLKLYIQEHFISTIEYGQEMAQFHEKLTQQIKFRHEITEYPMVYYEQYILGKIDFDEYKVRQQKIRQAAEDQKAIELEIEAHEQKYRRFSLLCKVNNKEFSLSEIMKEIDKITIECERKIAAKWK